MNKQFGYKELEMSFGMLPIKVGMYTVEGVLKDFSISLYELPSLMEIHNVEVEGEILQSELPKDLIKFLRSVLLHSANYIPWREGKSLYKEVDAHDWLEEIGFSTPAAFELIMFFRQAVKSGVAPVKPSGNESKKKESP